MRLQGRTLAASARRQASAVQRCATCWLEPATSTAIAGVASPSSWRRRPVPASGGRAVSAARVEHEPRHEARAGQAGRAGGAAARRQKAPPPAARRVQHHRGGGWVCAPVSNSRTRPSLPASANWSRAGLKAQNAGAQNGGGRVAAAGVSRSAPKKCTGRRPKRPQPHRSPRRRFCPRPPDPREATSRPTERGGHAILVSGALCRPLVTQFARLSRRHDAFSDCRAVQPALSLRQLRAYASRLAACAARAPRHRRWRSPAAAAPV